MLTQSYTGDLKDQLDAIIELVEMDADVTITEVNQCASITVDGVEMLVLSASATIFALAYILRTDYKTLE